MRESKVCFFVHPLWLHCAACVYLCVYVFTVGPV